MRAIGVSVAELLQISAFVAGAVALGCAENATIRVWRAAAAAVVAAAAAAEGRMGCHHWHNIHHISSSVIILHFKNSRLHNMEKLINKHNTTKVMAGSVPDSMQ